MRQTSLSLLLLSFFALRAMAVYSPEERKAIIQKFAPLVKFDDGEYYHPSSVKWFVDRCDLMTHQLKTTSSSSSAHSAASVGMISPWGSYLVKKKGEFGIKDLGNYATPEDGKLYFLRLVDDKDRAGEPKQPDGHYNAEVYANFVDLPNGAVIQYFFFYPFNGPFQPGGLVGGKSTFGKFMGKVSGAVGSVIGKVTAAADVGEHVGDWEHVQVYVKKTALGTGLSDVYFARHDSFKDGAFQSPGEYELAYGTHPVVYASKFGHSSHEHHSDFHEDRDKTSNKGPEWKTWENVVDIGSFDNPAPGNEWIRFSGRFGPTVPKNGNAVEKALYGANSPKGPAFQEFYRFAAFQTYPSEDQAPWAEVTVKTSEPKPLPPSGVFGNIKATVERAKEFRVVKVPDGFPTYIRNMVWQIEGEQGIAFTVWDDKMKYLFTINSDNQITPLHRGKMYIGDATYNGQKKAGEFKVQLRGINDYYAR